VIEKKEKREWRLEAKSEEMPVRRHFAESEGGYPLFFVSDRNTGLEALWFVSVLNKIIHFTKDGGGA
jgi:hypothetical protein